MKNKKIAYRLIAVVAIVFSVLTVSAQPGGPAGGTPGGGPPPAVGAPIDAGATVLLIGAAGYAYTQLKNKKSTAKYKSLRYHTTESRS